MSLSHAKLSEPEASVALAHRGFVLLERAMAGYERAKETFNSLFDSEELDTKSGSLRIDPAHGLVTLLLRNPAVAAIVEAAVGASARPIRAIAFNKTGNANWFVPWHQDRTIAVRQRDDGAPVSHWTVKHGVPHCEAPVALLSRMLTLRWHLDLVGPADGGLRVLPGSHNSGRLTTACLRDLAARTPAVELAVPAGTVLAMRPLLAHSSRRRTTEGHRRILHVELAAEDPPSPLHWAWA